MEQSNVDCEELFKLATGIGNVDLSGKWISDDRGYGGMPKMGYIVGRGGGIAPQTHGTADRSSEVEYFNVGKRLLSTYRCLQRLTPVGAASRSGRARW